MFSLYLCTDRALALGRPLLEAVEAAIDGGVTMVQLREKEAASREFYAIGLAMRELTKRRKVPLVVNDRLDIALAIGADGLHVGQSDLPLEAIRRIAGGRLFVGVSAGTVEKAIQAQADGADYLGAGAVAPTGSKADVSGIIGIEGLCAICAAVRIPVVGIGGINAATAAQVIQSGAAGIAVISSILSQPDIRSAAENLKRGIA
ncbi:MAG: thiamine phosphate synthase [Treponema sp.]|jgi:thiamine-phosphate pyrophosphorylase|nr:thiamine phosphate synthase [Treponema sp.]